MAAVAPQADLRSARIRNGGTWLAIAALALAITGCNDSGRTATVWVGNNTDVTLHFAIIDAHGKPFELRKEAAPGELIGLIEGSLLSPDAGIMIDACTLGDLIAYDPAGREVARHPPGLCARTKDVWTIGPPASPQPSG
jgi:hypothetical protein